MSVVLVTGGASGIGAAVVSLLRAEGLSVAACDIADGADFPLDVTDVRAVDAVVAAVESDLGPITGLVNSAGIASHGDFLDLSPDEFRRVLDINLFGTFHVSQAVATQMSMRGSGAIVNVASLNGLRAKPGRLAYSTSKAAVVMLTKTMALELGEHGIRVNAIAPGATDTPMTQSSHDEEDRERYGRSIPLGRYGTPEEIASVIAFLLDDSRAGYLSGDVLGVDGGLAGER